MIMIRRLLKKSKRLERLVLYLYHKRHNSKLVRFWYSTHLSPRCVFEGMNMVSPGSSYYGRMGYGTYIGGNSHLNADIGKFTSVGPNVRVINATHPMKEPFVTTCPLFFSLDRSKNPCHDTFAKKQMVEEFRYYDKERQIDIKIGNDCWIGEGVTFIGGTAVHDGAVVLAGAYVVKDVPSYAIVGGTPAKVIGYRYDEETIKFLQRIQWWNNEEQWLRDNWDLLCDMEKLKREWRDKYRGPSNKMNKEDRRDRFRGPSNKKNK